MKIPLSRPDISDDDIEAVVSVLRSGQLSLGSKLTEFEERFARYVNVAYGAALSSGTAGLILSLQALGVGEGDEVILPSFSFIATANSVRHVGATPVFADIDVASLNLTAETVRRSVTEKTRALLPVHTFGYPADMDSILEVARDYKLAVIEDACEAIGAEYRGQKIGSFGDVGVFSFYPNKPITAGEGGLVVANDEGLIKTIRALRNQGRMENDGWLEHTLLGYNYRLSDIHCALGISQLNRIESILARREEVAGYYYDALQNCPDITLPERNVADGRVSWFAFVVRLSSYIRRAARDEVLRALASADIGCRAYFPPIHLQPLYSKYAKSGPALPVTEDVGSRTVALPFYNALTRGDVERVCQVLVAAVREAGR